ncbi:hypothetical protein LCGC14_1885090, partial [marine sediment metagenome]
MSVKKALFNDGQTGALEAITVARNTATVDALGNTVAVNTARFGLTRLIGAQNAWTNEVDFSQRWKFIASGYDRDNTQEILIAFSADAGKIFIWEGNPLNTAYASVATVSASLVTSPNAGQQDIRKFDGTDTDTLAYRPRAFVILPGCILIQCDRNAWSGAVWESNGIALFTLQHNVAQTAWTLAKIGETSGDFQKANANARGRQWSMPSYYPAVGSTPSSLLEAFIPIVDYQFASGAALRGECYLARASRTAATDAWTLQLGLIYKDASDGTANRHFHTMAWTPRGMILGIGDGQVSNEVKLLVADDDDWSTIDYSVSTIASEITRTDGWHGGDGIGGLVKDITVATWVADVATITIDSTRGMDVGDNITVAGMTPSAYDGDFTIASVASSTTLTYALAIADPGAGSAFGTVANFDTKISGNQFAGACPGKDINTVLLGGDESNAAVYEITIPTTPAATVPQFRNVYGYKPEHDGTSSFHHNTLAMIRPAPERSTACFSIIRHEVEESQDRRFVYSPDAENFTTLARMPSNHSTGSLITLYQGKIATFGDYSSYASPAGVFSMTPPKGSTQRPLQVSNGHTNQIILATSTTLKDKTGGGNNAATAITDDTSVIGLGPVYECVVDNSSNMITWRPLSNPLTTDLTNIDVIYVVFYTKILTGQGLALLVHAKDMATGQADTETIALNTAGAWERHVVVLDCSTGQGPTQTTDTPKLGFTFQSIASNFYDVTVRLQFEGVYYDGRPPYPIQPTITSVATGAAEVVSIALPTLRTTWSIAMSLTLPESGMDWHGNLPAIHQYVLATLFTDSSNH